MAAFLPVFKKAEESGKLLSRQSQEHCFRILLLPLAPDNTLDLTASPVMAMISSDVLNTHGNCLIQAAFWASQGCSCLTLPSLHLSSGQFWEQPCDGWELLGWGKSPLTWKGLSAAERVSALCWLKLIGRSVLNSGCASSCGVGFHQLVWLSYCDMVCLQWQSGIRRRGADCAMTGSWVVAWYSRRDQT